MGTIEVEETQEEEGEDLCNCVFTLGYGSLTLLNNTRLHLKRGKNYGLLGLNDCGKTTLMRAINNEQVEGFPPKSELKTAFVEHGIGEAEPECDWSPFDYLLDEPVIKAMYDSGETDMKKMDPKDIKKAIKDVEKKLKDYKKKSSLTEEEAWALEDKLNELKEQLKTA